MDKRERRRLAREERANEGKDNNFRFGPVLGVVGILLVIVAGVVVSRVGQTRDPVATSPGVTPVARTATPTRVPDPDAQPTAPAAVFMVTDRCVTTTLETSTGPALIKGGGLEMQVRASSLTLLSYVGNIPGDIVCADTPPSREAVDAMMRGISEIPGLILQGYTYSGV